MWQDRASFCPLCGSNLAMCEVEGRPRRRCAACRFILYDNPAAAAATVVLRDREVVLVKRTIPPYRGDWTLPAGYEEYDETPVEAAIRETREECGLQVEPYGLYDLSYTRDDPRKRAVLMVFLCHVVGGRLVAGDDAAEARFFSIDALPPNVGFVNNRAVLERLRRELDAGRLRYLPLPV